MTGRILTGRTSRITMAGLAAGLVVTGMAALGPPSARAVPGPCDPSHNVFVNPGFEVGTFFPWVMLGTNNTPTVSTAQAHTGTHSALLGTPSGPEPTGDSSIYQQITVPTNPTLLSFWYRPSTTDTSSFDWQAAYVTNTSGTILATIFNQAINTQVWTNQTFDLTPYIGQTVRIEFLVHEDGFGDDTSMYVDDACLSPQTPRTLTVARTGPGSGTVTSTPSGISCGATCSAPYTNGTTVTLSETPAPGSTFTGWSGDCTGTGACQVTMTADRQVTATFTANPPDTQITKAKIKKKTHKGTFRFTAVGLAPATSFQCALVKKHHTASFKPCSSPKTYKHLKRGHYTFEVRAVGPGGVDPTPATKTFTIKK